MSPETPAERAEAAAIRRRWVTLGEIVAIAGLVISALALWSSWSERRVDEAARKAEKASEVRAQSMVMLRATPQDGGRRLTIADPAHSLQGVTIAFPTALGLAPLSQSVDPAIDAATIAPAILKATDRGPDRIEGRLPVLVTADYWDGDTKRRDTAIYDLIWLREGRFVTGHTLRLKGMVLHARKAATQAAIDARWAKLAPQPN